MSTVDLEIHEDEILLLESLTYEAYIGLVKYLNKECLSELGAKQLSNTLRTVNILRKKLDKAFILHYDRHQET